MITTFHFEVFAPGMKAKLDPTYRRVYESNRLPDKAEILGKIARSSQQSFIPFTTVRKSFDIFNH
jgi:hypothetical protein